MHSLRVHFPGAILSGDNGRDLYSWGPAVWTGRDNGKPGSGGRKYTFSSFILIIISLHYFSLSRGLYSKLDCTFLLILHAWLRWRNRVPGHLCQCQCGTVTNIPPVCEGSPAACRPASHPLIWMILYFSPLPLFISQWAWKYIKASCSLLNSHSVTSRCHLQMFAYHHQSVLFTMKQIALNFWNSSVCFNQLLRKII